MATKWHAQEERRRAAISRVTELGQRDSRGKLLPLRYRVAEAREAQAAKAAKSAKGVEGQTARGAKAPGAVLRGKKGGKYVMTASGKKRYVD